MTQASPGLSRHNSIAPRLHRGYSPFAWWIHLSYVDSRRTAVCGMAQWSQEKLTRNCLAQLLVQLIQTDGKIETRTTCFPA